MDTTQAGLGRLDCYEDMFKEITRKLYGEDPDQRTSSVENEFETSVNYKSHDEESDEDPQDSPKTNKSWKCGDTRDMSDHFMGYHTIGSSSSTTTTTLDNSRLQSRKESSSLITELKLEDVVSYLEKVRDRAVVIQSPLRKTQETQTIIPNTTFQLQDIKQDIKQEIIDHQNQNNSTNSNSNSSNSGTGHALGNGISKRYTCLYCPYGTDRRDLYTRHENIHKEEKPFHCYVCFKPFSRADHVKKHFLRMHRDQTYELSKIRKPPSSDTSSSNQATQPNTQQPQQQQQIPQQQPQQQQIQQQQPQQQLATNFAGNFDDVRLFEAAMPATKSNSKSSSKGSQERRYSCCYCSWSGVDNWCLKRHLNTHLKPFACTLCEYKAARAERLSTHVLKVHNRRQCSRCSFSAEDLPQLQIHQLQVHRMSNISATSLVKQESNQQQQTSSILNTTNGRPPPGPPVFPASTSTSVIPTSTTSVIGCSTMRRTLKEVDYERHRLRKQRQPRKILMKPNKIHDQSEPLDLAKVTNESYLHKLWRLSRGSTINNNNNNNFNNQNKESFSIISTS